MPLVLQVLVDLRVRRGLLLLELRGKGGGLREEGKRGAGGGGLVRVSCVASSAAAGAGALGEVSGDAGDKGAGVALGGVLAIQGVVVAGRQRALGEG